MRLVSADAKVRADAAWALAGAADAPTSLIASLEKLLVDEDGRVRQAATWALAHQDRAKDSYYDEPPKPIVMTQPVYPQRAFSDKVDGIVLTEILIDESGAVAHAEIRTSIAALDAAALQCVREWRFEPATARGQPVPAVARAPITFRIY